MRLTNQSVQTRALLCLLCIVLALGITAQRSYAQEFQRCGTDPAPAELERWIQPIADQLKMLPNNQRAVTTLPVVFHVIHFGESVGTGANVSDAQISSQIEVLNEDFRRLGAGANTHADGADAMIEFCLAATDRIDRGDEDWENIPWTKCYIDETIKPATIWDPTEYINVWVISSFTKCDGTGSLLGYSSWPEGPHGLSGVGTNTGTIEDEDGVVIKSSTTGRPPANTNGGAFDLGRTLTHELGHFFGLRHTWGDGDCGDDDYCGDTPNCSGPYYGCGTATEDCTDAGLRMIENYLDYSDDVCMNIFTNDQSARMQAVLSNSPRRMELSSAVCCEEGFATASGSNYGGFGISCNGGSDGSVTAGTTGGNAPFSYLWSTGATTVTVSGLSQGTYDVTITDAGGCEATASVTLTEPVVLIADASVKSDYNGEDISCNGGSNGVAEVLRTGGVLPYSYLWSDGQTTAGATGLSAGTYTVIVTDANGCTDDASVTLTEPDPVLVTALVSSDYNGQDISCLGVMDGEATASAGGGVPPYSYVWNDGQTSAIAIGLDATTYSVIATDANLCTDNTSLTLTQPDPVTASADAISDYNGWDISCFGGSDGVAEVTPGGGTPGYTYLWDANAGGQTTAVATGLSAGSYTVTVTDLNDCAISTSVTLFEPPPLTIDAGENQTVYFGYPPAACATISWSGEGGGVPPYTITWSDGGDPSHEVCPEVTTTYTVTITDLNGCVETDEVLICSIDVRCGKKLDKVEICHVDDEGAEHTLCVGLSSVASHLTNHSDMLAACGTDHNCPAASGAVRTHANNDDNAVISAFPNPFNRSALVQFSSLNGGMATVKLVDVLGNSVMELFHGQTMANVSYQFDVTADKLPGGVYFCILQLSDGTLRSIEMILTK